MKKTLRPYRGSICLSLMLALLLALQPLCAMAQTPAEIVEHAEDVLWGKTVTGDYEMKVTTPSWSRSLSLQIWMDRPLRSFVRIHAPAKDAGISFLRLKAEMWNYLPTIERTIKIPPSLMLQPWLGSDFSNDDLVKESNLVTDYTHRLLGEQNVNGDDAWQVESLPRPEAAVVWGKIVYSVRKSDFVPLRLEYFDERGNLIRTLSFSDIKVMGGHAIPTRWVMQPAANAGKNTTIVVKSVTYNKPISDDVFSLRNLTATRKQ